MKNSACFANIFQLWNP